MSQPIQTQQISLSVQKLAAHDEDEVAAFWEYCLPRLRYLFLRQLRSNGITNEGAEELATDTMLAIHKKLSGFGNKTSDEVLNYVFGSAYHLAQKYKQNEKRKRNLLARLSESARYPILPDPSKDITESIAVKDAFLKLPERYRKVFYLMHVKNKSIKDTASITGLSEVNVKKISSRAMDKLKLAAEFSQQVTPKLK